MFLYIASAIFKKKSWPLYYPNKHLPLFRRFFRSNTVHHLTSIMKYNSLSYNWNNLNWNCSHPSSGKIYYQQCTCIFWQWKNITTATSLWGKSRELTHRVQNTSFWKLERDHLTLNHMGIYEKNADIFKNVLTCDKVRIYLHFDANQGDGRGSHSRVSRDQDLRWCFRLVRLGDHL